MRHHYTTDPAIKAQHISDRIEEETFKKRVELSLDAMLLDYHFHCAVSDWPQREIETYQTVLQELVHDNS